MDKQIRKLQKQSSGATTKEAKDGIIKKIRLLQLQSKFWHNKYEAFIIEEDKVKGFTRRQGTDISVINKYGRSFLQTLFERVDVVKGTMTAAFREVWDIQEPTKRKTVQTMYTTALMPLRLRAWVNASTIDCQSIVTRKKKTVIAFMV